MRFAPIPESSRWLILIAFLLGVLIGSHSLNYWRTRAKAAEAEAAKRLIRIKLVEIEGSLAVVGPDGSIVTVIEAPEEKP